MVVHFQEQESHNKKELHRHPQQRFLTKHKNDVIIIEFTFNNLKPEISPSSSEG